VVTTIQAGGNISQINAIATDTNGNLFLVGTFTGTVNFGSTSLTSIGSSSGFVAKWSVATNNFLWAQQQAGSITALVVNGTSVYLGGFFQGTISFGGNTLTSAGGTDGFLAKLIDTGTSSSFVWAQSIGGIGEEFTFGLCANNTNLYIVGEFGSPTINLGGTTLTNAGTNSTDAFIAKLADTGNTASFTWAQRAGGSSRDYASAVAVSGTDVYVAGSFYSRMAGIGSFTLTNASSTISTSDIFITKLADVGSTSNFTWVQRAGGSLYDEPAVIAINGSNVYVTGRFNSQAIDFGGTTLTNASTSFDAFVAKLTDLGRTSSFTWAQRAGGTGHEAPSALVVSESSVFVAGSFFGAPATFGSTTLTNANRDDNTYDVFVTRLLDTGSTSSFTWAQHAGGTGNDSASGLLLNGTSLYVTGSITPPASFGSQIVSGPASTRIGFLASLVNQPLATTHPVWAGNLHVYPNPANRAVTLRLEAIPSVIQATLTICDALGRTIRTIHLPATNSIVEVSLLDITPGLYQLHIQAGTQHISRALTIE
jgi:hypothetical protein